MKRASLTAAPPTTSKRARQVLPKKIAGIATVLAAIFGVGFATTSSPGVQAYTIAEGFTAAFPVPILAFGVVYSIVVWVIVWGGGKRVVEFAGKIVPAMIVLFLAAGLGVVIINIRNLPEALALIFGSAFTGTAAVGGFSGAAASLVIQQGIARSVFSNEAGQGSSTMVHSQAKVEHPVRQGLWGMFEVFVDTMCVCTIMSLAIIMSGVWSSGSEGARCRLCLCHRLRLSGLPSSWALPFCSSASPLRRAGSCTMMCCCAMP